MTPYKVLFGVKVNNPWNIKDIIPEREALYKGIKRLQGRSEGIIYILSKSKGIALVKNKMLHKKKKGITRESHI
jgi:hypothetical protein